MVRFGELPPEVLHVGIDGPLVALVVVALHLRDEFEP